MNFFFTTLLLSLMAPQSTTEARGVMTHYTNQYCILHGGTSIKQIEEARGGEKRSDLRTYHTQNASQRGEQREHVYHRGVERVESRSFWGVTSPHIQTATAHVSTVYPLLHVNGIICVVGPRVAQQQQQYV